MRINMVDKVRQYIDYRPSLADSDVDLIWCIWINQVSKIINPHKRRSHYMIPERERDVSKMPAVEIMKLWKHGKISSPSNITRSRRRCQELYPETRGKVYAERQKQQQRVIEDIRNTARSERATGNVERTANIPNNETQKRVIFDT